MQTNDFIAVTTASDSFHPCVITANYIALKMQMIKACISKSGRPSEKQHSRFEDTIEIFELKIIVSFEIRVDMGVGDKIEFGGTDLLSKKELLLTSLSAEKLLAASLKNMDLKNLFLGNK